MSFYRNLPCLNNDIKKTDMKNSQILFQCYQIIKLKNCKTPAKQGQKEQVTIFPKNSKENAPKSQEKAQEVLIVRQKSQEFGKNGLKTAKILLFWLL